MKLLADHNNVVIKRSNLFVQSIYTFCSIPFLYICVEVIIRKQILFDIASPTFVAYAFFDFFILTWFFVVIVYYGMLANNVDFKIKDIFMNISKDCIDLKALSDKRMIWAKIVNLNSSDEDLDKNIKKDNLFILKKQKNGTWKNEDNLEVDINNYVDIND